MILGTLNFSTQMGASMLYSSVVDAIYGHKDNRTNKICRRRLFESSVSTTTFLDFYRDASHMLRVTSNWSDRKAMSS